MFPSHLAWNVRIRGQMARRRQEADAVGLVAQLAGLVVLTSLFSPAVRRALAELGFIAVCFSILVVAGLVCREVTVREDAHPPGFNKFSI
jgi:hypothetical protein